MTMPELTPSEQQAEQLDMAQRAEQSALALAARVAIDLETYKAEIAVRDQIIADMGSNTGYVLGLHTDIRRLRALIDELKEQISDLEFRLDLSQST